MTPSPLRGLDEEALEETDRDRERERQKGGVMRETEGREGVMGVSDW